MRNPPKHQQLNEFREEISLHREKNVNTRLKMTLNRHPKVPLCEKRLSGVSSGTDRLFRFSRCYNLWELEIWLAAHRRLTFHYTPTSCSRMNAVEGFFGKREFRRGFREVDSGLY